MATSSASRRPGRGCRSGFRGRWPEPRGAFLEAVRDPGRNVWAADAHPIATVAVDTLLVTRADITRVAVYDVLHAVQEMGPLLVAERPISQSTISRPSKYLTSRFRCIPALWDFVRATSLVFAERASGIFEVAVTVLAGLTAGLFALVRVSRGRKKARIDEFYAEALAIRAKLLQEPEAQQRSLCIEQLRDLRDRAFTLPIEEKLSPDESFRILQSLVSNILYEFDTRGSARTPTRPRLSLARSGSGILDDADDLRDRRVRFRADAATASLATGYSGSFGRGARA